MCDPDTPRPHKLECMVCGDTESESELGLYCDTRAHYLCPEHTRAFFRSALQGNEVPLRCSECKEAYYPRQLQALFTPEEARKYAEVSAFLAKADDEVLLTCLSCGVPVLVDQQDVPTLFYCRNPTCPRPQWCTVCCEAFDTATAAQRQLAAERHLIGCGAVAAVKAGVAAALEGGGCRACPHCGMRVRKDKKCTHMTCPRCQGVWCYVCGMKKEDCQRPADSLLSIFSHKIDWQKYPERCPMYLEHFSEIDPSWPKTDADAATRFHSDRTLRLLQRVLQTHGMEAMEAALAKEPGLLSGFSLSSVQQFHDLPAMAERVKHWK